MSLAERIFGLESRTSVSQADPRDPVVAEWFGGSANTAAGVSIDADKALRLTAVYACVRILSNAIASLPLRLFRRTADGREPVEDYSLYRVLHDAPNRWQTPFEYREMLAGHLLLRGNAYSQIVLNRDGSVAELVPLNPDRVRPFWTESRRVAYEYTPESGEKTTLLDSEVHHIRGFSSGGLKGLSPIEYMREAIGLTMGAEEFGARFFGNGTVTSGVLEHPGALGDVAFDRLKRDFAARHQGLGNSHKPIILEEGMKWHALGIAPEQAQFLETRKFQVSEIARIFGVPPHMIGDVEKSTSWGSGIEQQGIGFVVYSLRPWLVRWEQAIKRDLLATSAARDIYASYNVDALLRGDSKARGEFYRQMWGIGAYSINEIRARENENPVEGGDTRFVPVNMANMQTMASGSEPAPAEPQAGARKAHIALDVIYRRSLSAAADRIAVAEVRAVERMHNKADGLAELERQVVEFYAKHDGFMRKHLEPLIADPDPLITAHIHERQADLLNCLLAEDPDQALQDMLADWRDTLAQRIADKAPGPLEVLNDGS